MTRCRRSGVNNYNRRNESTMKAREITNWYEVKPSHITKPAGGFKLKSLVCGHEPPAVRVL